jgi:hypothetical protein
MMKPEWRKNRKTFALQSSSFMNILSNIISGAYPFFVAPAPHHPVVKSEVKSSAYTTLAGGKLL